MQKTIAKKIQDEIQKIRAKYLASANEIVKGYAEEVRLSNDYAGRQMFELLQNVAFYLSANELNCGCVNKKNYRVIYVFLKEDGKSPERVYDLGYIFDMEEGEDLFHNNRFSIISDSYKIVANQLTK